MEPTLIASTAAAATALLTPYVAKAAEEAAKEVGKKMPQAVAKLWSSIRARFKGKPAAEEAVTDLVVKPQDADIVATFRGQLKKTMESDAHFAEELIQLLKAAQEEAGVTTINTGSGAVATKGGVAAGKGGVAVKGDVHRGIHVGKAPKD